ncbi:hypothetical protein [Streptomyces sp. KHY 26]|uniref:hypothetical protein n=1 Tax=Streptomyces sp. KHY 26 TaxID=3097359 RepID=UPI00376ECCF8
MRPRGGFRVAANATATLPSTPAPAAVDDDHAVGLREAAEHHLPGITLAALRFARANDPAFPDSAGKRGAELLYRVGDLKKWARNRPRAELDLSAFADTIPSPARKNTPHRTEREYRTMKTVLPTKLSFHAPDLREQIEALPEGTALIGINTPIWMTDADVVNWLTDTADPES